MGQLKLAFVLKLLLRITGSITKFSKFVLSLLTQCRSNIVINFSFLSKSKELIKQGLNFKFLFAKFFFNIQAVHRYFNNFENTEIFHIFEIFFFACLIFKGVNSNMLTFRNVLQNLEKLWNLSWNRNVSDCLMPVHRVYVCMSHGT